MKSISSIQLHRIGNSTRNRFNPIRSLTPETLTRTLDQFNSGYLRPAALLWDAIERRDDILKGVSDKRKKSVSRLKWEILTTDNSPLAQEQQRLLKFFYNHLRCTNAYDQNEEGSVALLIRQMMDAVGKKYAVHEILLATEDQNEPMTLPQELQQDTEVYNTPRIYGELKFVPLWFFENRSGKLRFLENDTDSEGIPLERGHWMTTVGEGLMEACSIAYLFKHLPLRDWLVYCERNGMPGVKGITEALPNTPQWEAAKQAVESFGAEFNTLISKGSDIQTIDLTTRGDLPYPQLVDRMDRAMAALWCGSDLSTLSRSSGTGASLQAEEKLLIEQEDAQMISETLNEQLDRYVVQAAMGNVPVKAYFQLCPNSKTKLTEEVELFKKLRDLGIEIPENDLRERLGIGSTTSLQS